jgi:mannose-1-phosphate guanylyltransferase/phosphomannomutase
MGVDGREEGLKAVVMAGGEGSRLRPVTSSLPKPLVPIANEPIMAHILTLLRRHKITSVVATLHYLADEIQSYFGDGSDFGVKLKYTVEGSPLGTAGSVKKAESLLTGDTFVIISGDALTDCDLTAAIEFHRRRKSLATLVLHKVPNPLEFGVVITGDDGKIERFLEKPGWSEVFSDTVNTGIYIFEPEIFNYLEPDTKADWSSDVFPKLLALGKPMYGYVMEGYWCDIGTLSQYRDAQQDLLTGNVDLPVNASESQVEDGRYIGQNCSIDDGVTIVPPVCIGRNCRIKRGARIGPFTVLGDNTFVEESALVERSVVWDNAYIGPNVGILSAIVCSRATIKRDTVIREDAVIGDRCFIDVGCTIRPRVKLWPDKSVERGSTVTMSLVWGNRWRGSLFRELGVAGLSNIEITPDFACRLASAYGSTLPPGTKVVTSRDSTRSSRMIKRAVIASLLSAGCDVLDLRSMSLPVAKHFIKASGAGGAVHVRKLPGNSRVSLIELMDSTGGYLLRPAERKVENAFFREDYRRADPDELGTIEFASRAIEEYQADFYQLLEHGDYAKRHLRVACDYGYSSIAAYFPAMLARLGVESVTLNGFNDAKRAPRTAEQTAFHLENLKNIVGTLKYDAGVLFLDDGERLALIDDRGQVLEGPTLLSVFCTLLAKTKPASKLALSVTAPSRLELALQQAGAEVIRTKADARSLLTTAVEQSVDLAGDDKGGFLFPEMQNGFDAPFAFGKLLMLLRESGLTLAEVAEGVPTFELAYEAVRVPWESKGAIMRVLAEENRDDARTELLDGIKIFDQDAWVLVLPDALEPLFHVYAESNDHTQSKDLASGYAKRIDELQGALK